MVHKAEEQNMVQKQEDNKLEATRIEFEFILEGVRAPPPWGSYGILWDPLVSFFANSGGHTHTFENKLEFDSSSFLVCTRSYGQSTCSRIRNKALSEAVSARWQKTLPHLPVFAA